MAAPQMQLEDWLDDLCVRFIINLPQEDLSSVARICFQVEEAQWFYEDFIRPLDPTLPSMSLRTFCLRIFQHCPLLASFSVENHTKAFEEFLEYKTRVPVRGAILLNEAMDSTVLVKGWKKGANWSFPRGKINKDEDDLDCAVREVYEETGLDLQAAGLVPTEHKPKYIEISMREQHMRLYVFRDVPMDTNFEPRTRKEISKIQWYKLSELPAFRRKGAQNQEPAGVPNANKFYMVAPFLVPLKKWVVSQKKIDARRAASGAHAHLHTQTSIDEVHTEEDWTQTDTGAEASTGAPTLETMAGATQELHRLLKIQPSTQGLQPVSTEQDKGSALLSILQSRGNAPPPVPLHGTQQPQTPLDLSLGEAPQPRTPHHHNHHQVPTINTQQPPPSFPYPPNQPVSWNQPLAQGHQPQYHNQPHPDAFQQQYGAIQAPLVHPQPLPPQVQRDVFNRSAFQEGLQNKYPGPQGPQLNQQPPSQQFPQARQMAPPGSMNMGPAHLTGQSMALLNAFKTGNNAPQSKENIRQQQGPVSGDLRQNYPTSYGQNGLPQEQPQIQPQTQAQMPRVLNNQNRAQVSPQELAGSRVGPPADNHRSTLLGMFQKTNTETVPGQIQNPNQGYVSDPPISVPAQASSRGKADPNPPLSLDALSIQPQINQSGASPAQVRANFASQHTAHPPVPNFSQPTQPTRMLQRGQADPSMGFTGLPAASPRFSPHSSVGQQSVGKATNSPSAGSMLPPPPLGAQNQRPQSGADQKRQLLSLFGSKQPSPVGLEMGRGKEVVTETPRSRVASLASGIGELAGSSSPSRRSSQTPISPADRTFLLGYLESVTGNATR
ncbi:Fc.00g076050.m01.CDS01 [Cosmosporella sp. VM-42]